MTPLKEQLQLTRLRFTYFFKWQRLLGLAVTALLGYLLLFVVLGRFDVGRYLPWSTSSHFHWPDLPRFLTWKQTAPDGREETIYTVPSRQLTPQEMSQLGATNAAPAAK